MGLGLLLGAVVVVLVLPRGAAVVGERVRLRVSRAYAEKARAPVRC